MTSGVLTDISVVHAILKEVYHVIHIFLYSTWYTDICATCGVYMCACIVPRKGTMYLFMALTQHQGYVFASYGAANF